MNRVILVLALLAITACHRHGNELRVRVLYSASNPNIVKLRQGEREFSFTDPRLRNGKPFVLVPDTVSEPTPVLADKKKSESIDLVILKSADELPDDPVLLKAMGDRFSVCNEAVAYIPDWSAEERREGAAHFLQYLSTHCR
ncbi:MAG TPA: hypothetical protein VGL89_13460 [Candidatus Koribacter sp.]